jgi:hypothetical protein
MTEERARRHGRPAGNAETGQGFKRGLTVAEFVTPAMVALGIRPVKVELYEPGYPPVDVQEIISAKIVAAEEATAKKPAKPAAEVKCARPSCRNMFVRRRRDQHTCGTPRCRAWWSRQGRKNVIVARRRSGGGGGAEKRERASKHGARIGQL